MQIEATCEVCGIKSPPSKHKWAPKWGLTPFCPKCATPERLAAFQERCAAAGRKRTQAVYACKPKGRIARTAAQLQYTETEKGRKTRREAQLRYAQTEKGRKALREAQAKYRKSPKGQAAYAALLARRRTASEKSMHNVSVQPS